MDINLHAYNALHRQHMVQEEANKASLFKSRSDVLDTLSDASKSHGDRRIAQSKFSADLVGAKITRHQQTGQFVKAQDEGFEHLLEPHELEEWNNYNQNIKRAMWDAKMGRGPKPEENPNVKATWDLAEVNPVDVIINSVARNRGLTCKPSAKSSSGTSDKDSNDAAGGDSPTKANFGRRSGASLDNSSRATSGRASQTNLFIVQHPPPPAGAAADAFHSQMSPRGQQGQGSLLALVRAREANLEVGGRGSYSGVGSNSITTVLTPRGGATDQPLAAPQPSLGAMRNGPSVRWTLDVPHEEGCSSEDEDGRESSGDGKRQSRRSSYNGGTGQVSGIDRFSQSGSIRHGRRSGNSQTALSVSGPGSWDAGSPPARNAYHSMSFNGASGGSGVLVQDLTSRFAPPAAAGRMSVNGSGPTAGALPSQPGIVIGASVAQMAEASRAEFMRLLHGVGTGAKDSNHSGLRHGDTKAAAKAGVRPVEPVANSTCSHQAMLNSINLNSALSRSGGASSSSGVLPSTATSASSGNYGLLLHRPGPTPYAGQGVASNPVSNMNQILPSARARNVGRRVAGESATQATV